MPIDRRSFIGLAVASHVVSAEELTAFNSLAESTPLALNPTTISTSDPGPFYLDVEGFEFTVNSVIPTLLASASRTLIHIPTGAVLRDNTGVAPDQWVDIDILGDTLDQCCPWPYPTPQPVRLGEVSEAYFAARKFLLFLSLKASVDEDNARLRQIHRSYVGRPSTYSDWYF